MINPNIKERIVLALDVNTTDEAKELILELKDYVGVFKVGLQFYTSNGSEIFDFMKSVGVKFFFDVKLMDIPNTVKKATENIIKSGASFYNVHALGGYEMMSESARAANLTAKKLGEKQPISLAVTLLTSIGQDTLNKELGINEDYLYYVVNLAKLAQKSGMTGVVASVNEVRKIKEACGKEFKVLCPGIRPEWSLKGDQKRIATPSFAIKEGADYLVIGRAVTQAENKLEAMKKIYEEISNG